MGQLIYNSSRTTQLRRELRHGKSEEEEAARSNCPHPTHAIVNPIETHDKPSNYNDEVRKRKSSSGISDKEMESIPKKKHIQKSFAQRMDDLRVYKEKHGHVNVKQSDDKNLSDFCKRMKHARNHPEKSSHLVNNDRIASLDALGFEWAVLPTKLFKQRVEDLQAYKEKHGHVNVKNSEDKSLCGFCRQIRHARKNPEKSNMLINDERIASLDALGFDWKVKERVEKSFTQRIEDMQAYKKNTDM